MRSNLLKAKRILNFLVLLATAGALMGCATVGPDYHEPEVEWLDEWETDLYGQAGGLDAGNQGDLSFWWRLFDDPVLNELIETARRENPSLHIAGLRVLESRAALGYARGTRYPQLQQATGDMAYVNTRDSGEESNDQVVYSADLNIGWEIDFWGKFRRSIESADAAFFASIANQQNVQVLLSAQVADLYFAYRTTQLRIDIAKENASIQKRSFEITERLYLGGEDSELDLQQAKTQYMATLSTIPGLEITRGQLRNAICAMLGRAPGDLPELDSETGDLPAVEPVILEGIPARLLMRRPDIRAAAAQVASQSARIGMAKADLYPSISLFGNIGWSGSTVEGSSNTLSLGVGPSFTWNLFNYGRIKNNVRVQDARLQQAIENFQNVALQAAREIDDAALRIVKTEEQQVPQRQSTQAAKRSLELANSRYREGYADFQRVIEAQRAFAAQNDREILNQSSHISAVISFYKAIGGGWLDMTIEQMLPGNIRDAMEERTDWDDLLRDSLPAESDSLYSNQKVEDGE